MCIKYNENKTFKQFILMLLTNNIKHNIFDVKLLSKKHKYTIALITTESSCYKHGTRSLNRPKYYFPLSCPVRKHDKCNFQLTPNLEEYRT